MATAQDLKNALASFNVPEQKYYSQPQEEEPTGPLVKSESPLTTTERFLWSGMRSPEAKKMFLEKRFKDVVSPDMSPTGDWATRNENGEYFPVDPKGFGKGGIKEMFGDVAESVPDILLGIGTTAGQTLGTAAGVPLAPFTAGASIPAGEIAGGAAAGAGGEAGWQKLARKLSGQEEIPLSGKDIAISGAVGAIPFGGIAKGLKSVFGKEAGKVAEKGIEKFTRTEALAKGTKMPGSHVAEETLEAAQKGENFLPPKHKDAGDLFLDADKSMMDAHEAIDNHIKTEFSKELKDKGITDATKFDIKPIKPQIKQIVQDLKDADSDKKTIRFFEEMTKGKTNLTYAKIKELKDELGANFRGMMRHGGQYKDINATKKALDALRSVEDNVVPGMKELKLKYKKGLDAQEAMESINRNISNESRAVFNTEEITGRNRLSMLGNEKTNLGNYRALKEVSNYMQEVGLGTKDFWKKLNQALISDVETGKKAGKGLGEAVMGFNFNKPFQSLGEVAGAINPVGTPSKRLRLESHALRALGKIPGVNQAMQQNVSPWLAGNISQNLAALFPTKSTVKGMTIAELKNLLSKAVNR